MNKIIPFNKDITFNENIGEIESIALDDTLKFDDSYNIKGELIVRGCNKYQDIEKEFSYPIPAHITVDTKYDTSKAKIMVDDFYYEIINDNILRVKIDLMLDDLYYKEERIEKEVMEIPFEKNKNDIENNSTVDTAEEKKDVIDLFQENVGNDEKEYSIYRVYVIGENDTLNSILDKYKVTKEDLEEINDLSNLKVGTKLIIPSIDE